MTINTENFPPNWSEAIEYLFSNPFEAQVQETAPSDEPASEGCVVEFNVYMTDEALTLRMSCDDDFLEMDLGRDDAEKLAVAIKQFLSREPKA